MSSGFLRSKLTSATKYGENLEKQLETYTPLKLPKSNPYRTYSQMLDLQKLHSKVKTKTILDLHKNPIPPSTSKGTQSIKATRFVRNKQGGKTYRRHKTRRTYKKKHSTRKHT